MNSLHKQLRHLIAFHGIRETDVDQCVGDIEKAIADATKSNYVGSDHIIPPPSGYSEADLKAISEIWSKPRMTGQEYVDAYNKMFKQIIDEEYGPEVQPLEVPTWLVMEVARRATGIDSGGE